MSSKTLHQLYAEHTGKVSDKWSLYLTEYDRLFNDYRDKPVRLLEIGIQNGGSLEIWSEYFSKAEKIIGCDIDRKCEQLRYGDHRISVLVGDANSDDCQRRVLQQFPSFDIIIDDGSHKSSDIVRSFARYFPHISDGGIYVVEDIHASYWKDFEGGLHDPLSAMAFFKRLADIVNYEHWRNNKPRKNLVKEFTTHFGVDFDNYDLARIHSIEFVNSLCVIKKLPAEKNVIGKRIITGSEECVSKGWHKLNATSIQDIAMDISDDEHLDVFELANNVASLNQAVQTLTEQVAERNRQIAALNQVVAARDGQIDNLDQAVQTLTEQVAEKEQQTTALIGQLCEITISKAWRLAIMMRSIRVWLAPPTSWRTRLLRRMPSLVLSPFKIRQNWRIARDLALLHASNLYDELWYLANNPDVAQAGVDPAYHYLRHGGFEGRDPGTDFSSACYLDAYEDVKKNGINPLIHYLKQGRKEGRHPNLGNNDIALIRSSGFFDFFNEAWYLANNPDVAQAGVDPTRHYLHHGGFEGRDPGTDFSSAWYLDTYRDVRISGENPLIHFLRYGRAEGRDPKPQKLTPAVRASLQNILKRLDISCTANEIISALSEYGNYIKTRQIMANIVEVETFLSAAKNREVYSLIQAAQLPEASPNTRKKNILFITSEFPDPHHGGGNRVLNFIESLSKDNDIYLCAAFHQPEHEIHLPIVEKYCKSILKIPHAHFGGNQEEIREWLHGLPLDIIHYEWPHSLKNYAPDFGKYQIFTYMEATSLRLSMDMERLKPLSKEWLDKFEQLSYALQLELVRASLLHARVAVTSKDGRFFQKLFPFQEYAVLNHGLDFENFTLPDVEPEPQTIVFVGNYKHYPNMDALHYFFGKIWEDIRNEVPEIRIYVVGSFPPRELLQMADGKSIIVTGAVPDVRPYIQRASVCIAPLISGAGLRGKVIEYAALRRTFVATSIAATDLNFKDGIDYFCADKPEEFSQKIIRLVKNPQLATQMADSAYNTAKKNYGTKCLTGYLLSLYQYLENQSNVK